MGSVNSKSPSCPFEQLLQIKRDKAKRMEFILGKTSDFYCLCKDGKTNEVRQILQGEGSPSIDELNQLQPNGSTPLHVATYNNHLEIVKLLLEYGCSRLTLNRYGYTAYDEAQSDEMKNLFIRPNSSTDRFHEINTTDVISMFFPEEDITSVNMSKTTSYVHLFRTECEIFEHSLNQQTTAMWLKFYNWFFHTFQTFIEREDLRVEAFDLINHLDFKQFLKQKLPDPDKYAKTMQSIKEATQRNSIEPLITLYTSEAAGFYRPFNSVLTQSSSNTETNEHLCDRYVIEFHIRRQELKQRAFTGITYRGATMSVNDLAVYHQAMASNRPGVIGLKAFTSTSRDPLVALQFAFTNLRNENERHVLFIFEITEPSSTIFGVDDVSIYSHEQEVLILPGNLFIVKKIQEKLHPPITRIYLSHWQISISFWEKIRQTFRAGKKSVL